jgi:hypothetical protein
MIEDGIRRSSFCFSVGSFAVEKVFDFDVHISLFYTQQLL